MPHGRNAVLVDRETVGGEAFGKQSSHFVKDFCPNASPRQATHQQFKMHETDMTKALIVTVRDWWNEQPDREALPEGYRPKIDRVHLTIGQFTCVEPVSLQFAFEVQTRGTFLEGAELVIAETPLIAFCHTCQQEYHPEIGIQYACPTCHAPMDDIRSGRELKIDRIEYTQSPTPEVQNAPNL